METKPKKLKLTIEQKIEKSKITEARRKEYQANYYKNLRSGLGSLTQDECKARQRLYFKTYRSTHGNYNSNKESILKYQKTQKGIALGFSQQFFMDVLHSQAKYMHENV